MLVKKNKQNTYITKTTIKYIQRAIILIVIHVMDKIFHFHLNTISLIVFSTFKSLITIFFSNSLKIRFLKMVNILYSLYTIIKHNNNILIGINIL